MIHTQWAFSFSEDHFFPSGELGTQRICPLFFSPLVGTEPDFPFFPSECSPSSRTSRSDVHPFLCFSFAHALCLLAFSPRDSVPSPLATSSGDTQFPPCRLTLLPFSPFHLLLPRPRPRRRHLLPLSSGLIFIQHLSISRSTDFFPPSPFPASSIQRVRTQRTPPPSFFPPLFLFSLPSRTATESTDGEAKHLVEDAVEFDVAQRGRPRSASPLSSSRNGKECSARLSPPLQAPFPATVVHAGEIESLQPRGSFPLLSKKKVER